MDPPIQPADQADEALRADTPLTAAERDAHDAGQVSVLLHLHQRLDATVAAAYGWPMDLSASEIVARVVALNAARAAEEAAGQVRWLRPEYQAPEETRRRAMQRPLDIAAAASVAPVWPTEAPDQFVALRRALGGGPATPKDLAGRFARAPARRIGAMLKTLTALGQARETPDGRYAA